MPWPKSRPAAPAGSAPVDTTGVPRRSINKSRRSARCWTRLQRTASIAGCNSATCPTCLNANSRPGSRCSRRSSGSSRAIRRSVRGKASMSLRIRTGRPGAGGRARACLPGFARDRHRPSRGRAPGPGEHRGSAHSRTGPPSTSPAPTSIRSPTRRGRTQAARTRDISVVGDITGRWCAAAGGKPVWMTLQVAWSGVIPTDSTPATCPRFPTLNQERFMAYQAIVERRAGTGVLRRPSHADRTAGRRAAGWNWTFWERVLRPLFGELTSDSVAPALVAPDSRKAVKASTKAVELVTRDAGGLPLRHRRQARGGTSRVAFSGLPKKRDGQPITGGEVLFEYVQEPLPPPVEPDGQTFRTVPGRRRSLPRLVRAARRSCLPLPAIATSSRIDPMRGEFVLDTAVVRSFVADVQATIAVRLVSRSRPARRSGLASRICSPTRTGSRPSTRPPRRRAGWAAASGNGSSTAPKTTRCRSSPSSSRPAPRRRSTTTSPGGSSASIAGSRTRRSTRERDGALELVERRFLVPGDFYVLIPPRDDIHRVRTTSAETSVSIHLLTNDTGCVWRHSFDAASGEARPFRSGYVNVACED